MRNIMKVSFFSWPLVCYLFGPRRRMLDHGDRVGVDLSVPVGGYYYGDPYYYGAPYYYG